MDEETRFSSVFRGVNESGYDEKENLLDSRNIETFGDASDSVSSKSSTAFISGKSNDGAQVPSSSLSVDDVQSPQSITGRELYRSVSHDHGRQLSSDRFPKTLLAFDGGIRVQGNQFNEKLVGSNYTKEESEKQTLAEETQASKTEDVLTEFIQYIRAPMIKQGIITDELSADSHTRKVNGSCPLMPKEVFGTLFHFGKNLWPFEQ